MGNHRAKDGVASAIVAQQTAGSRGSPADRAAAGPPSSVAGQARQAERPSAGSAPAASPASQVPRQGSGSRRASVREALDAALAGATLSGRDRQFLTMLIKWDKRNAASVVALLWRARMAGRAEAALTGRQLGIVLRALTDAAAYRESGAASIGCWDCENIPGGRCAEHSNDPDLAQACIELASVLAAGNGTAGELPQPAEIAGQRQYSTVAS
jgi:hypothetical protein